MLAVFLPLSLPWVSFGQTNILRDYYTESIPRKTFVILKLDRKPDYEVVPYQGSKQLTIKLRNTSFGKSLNMAKAFPSSIFLNATVQKMPNKETWVVIQSTVKDLVYNVLGSALDQGYLVLEIYSDANRKEIISGKNYLEKILVFHGKDGEKISFIFSKPFSYNLKSLSLPNEVYKIEIPNVELGFDQRKWMNDSESIQDIKFQQNGANLSIELGLKANYQKTRAAALENPFQFLFEMRPFGSPSIPLEEEARFIEEVPIAQKERSLRSDYVKAEKLLRAKDFKTAGTIFQGIFLRAPSEEIGIRAGFRYAESLQQEQAANPRKENYATINRAYQAAIEAANNTKLILSDIALAYLRMAENEENDGFYEEAYDQYSRLIKQFPQSLYSQDAYFKRAGIVLRMERYDEAIKAYLDFIQKYPNSRFAALANYLLATAYHKKNQDDLAYTYFQKARNINLEAGQTNPDFLKAMGEVYIARRDFEKGVQAYQTLLNDFPDYNDLIKAALQFGSYYEKAGERQRALDVYQQILAYKKWQKNPYLMMRLADFYSVGVSSKDQEAGLKIYQELTKSPQKTVAEDAAFKIATNYSLHGFYEQSLANLDLFKNAYPQSRYLADGMVEALTFENLTEIFAGAYLRAEYNKILTFYFRYRDKIDAKRDAFIYWLIANSYETLSNYKESSRFYQYLLIDNNAGARAGEILFAIGDNAFQLGNYDEAENYFKQTIAEDPRSIFAAYGRLRLAKIHWKNKDYEVTLKDYKDFIQSYERTSDPLLFDAVSEAWFELGEVYKDLGLFEDALASYNQVAKSFKHPLKDPSAPSYVSLAAYYTGDMLKEIGEKDKAIAAYEKAANYYPNSERMPWSKFYAATVYQDKKEYQRALDLYNVLLDPAQTPVVGQAAPIWRRLASLAKQEIENNQNYARYLRGDN